MVRTEQEIKDEIKKLENEMLNIICDYPTSKNSSQIVSMRSYKHMINSLRWCLGDIKEIRKGYECKKIKGSR